MQIYIKRKILRTNSYYVYTPSFVDIDNEFIDAVQREAYHKYLGRILNLSIH